jgi:MYXO-CTERM domain-containing protein
LSKYGLKVRTADKNPKKPKDAAKKKAQQKADAKAKVKAKKKAKKKAKAEKSGCGCASASHKSGGMLAGLWAGLLGLMAFRRRE